MKEPTMAVKNDVSDLAIFGGSPAVREPLHVGRPNIGNRQNLLERFNELLDRRWLTNNGPLVQQFEDMIKDITSVKHCISVSNGTIALELASRALDMNKEVIIPSFTFVATAHALQWQGVRPVFCDIDPNTHLIDPEQIESWITPHTTGILPVHVWGRTCCIDQIQNIARTNNLKVLYDASHAFHCSHKRKMVGNFGDAETLSFHATKFINTFEGGAILTNNDDLAKKIRLMRNFGFAGLDNVEYIGTNGKMSEVAAAMGITSLESIDRFIKINERNYIAYQERLSDIDGLSMITYENEEYYNYQHIVIEIDANITGISRDLLLRILTTENILARRYFYPGVHNMEPYRSYYPNTGHFLVNTIAVASRVLVLPNGSTVSDDAIECITDLIRFALKNAREITRRMGDLI